MLRPLLPGIVIVNAALKDRRPDLWEKIKHLPPSEAHKKLARKLGFEYKPGRSITGFCIVVLDRLGVSDAEARAYEREWAASEEALRFSFKAWVKQLIRI